MKKFEDLDKTEKLLKDLKDKKATYPTDHKAAMKVPKGGSTCSKCKFWVKDGNKCNSKYYIKYMGTDQIPLPADEFCSDWFIAK